MTSDFPDPLVRLNEIVAQLKTLYSDLAFNKSEELRAKRDAWTNSTESSQSGREKFATFSAADHTIAVWDIEAQINSLIEEKWLIQTILKYGDNNGIS